MKTAAEALEAKEKVCTLWKMLQIMSGQIVRWHSKIQCCIDILCSALYFLLVTLHGATCWCCRAPPLAELADGGLEQSHDRNRGAITS
jgi:hypothetical protein